MLGAGLIGDTGLHVLDRGTVAVRLVPLGERVGVGLVEEVVERPQAKLDLDGTHRSDCPGGGPDAGSEKLKVAPFPGAPSAQTRPPCASTARRTMARPIPTLVLAAVKALEHLEELGGVQHVEARRRCL